MPYAGERGFQRYNLDTGDIPTLANYAEAKAHIESVKPWRGSDWTPLGGRRSTIKKIRMRGDGTIVVRFYETDLVHYSVDGRITVLGYRTLATGDFLHALLPSEISLYNNDPRCDDGHQDELVLHLCKTGERHHMEDRTQEPEMTIYGGPYYPYRDNDDIIVVRCDRPATLRFDEREQRWVPDDAPSFKVPVLDREKTRRVAREYRLAQFALAARAVIALNGIRRQPGSDDYSIARALKVGNFAEAVERLPIGEEVRKFGRWHGGPGRINPGYLTRLRDWIYEHEGCVTFDPQPFLMLTEYNRYRKLRRRFS